MYHSNALNADERYRDTPDAYYGTAMTSRNPSSLNKMSRKNECAHICVEWTILEKIRPQRKALRTITLAISRNILRRVCISGIAKLAMLRSESHVNGVLGKNCHWLLPILYNVQSLVWNYTFPNPFFVKCSETNTNKKLKKKKKKTSNLERGKKGTGKKNLGD